MSTIRAEEIVECATAKAVEIGVNACIAVVDAGAHLKSFHLMNGAIIGAVDVSQPKARTSAWFAAPSGDFGQLLIEDQLLGMELSNGGLAGFPGGVPIYDEGLLIGGLGVSGGSAEQDHEITLAAV